MLVVFLLLAMDMPVYVCSVPFACHGHASMLVVILLLAMDMPVYVGSLPFACHGHASICW